jgi:glycerol kinase
MSSHDASNASRTLLFNLQTGDWDDELLNFFQIPRAMLPTIADSSGVIGEVTYPQNLAGIAIAGIVGSTF